METNANYQMDANEADRDIRELNTPANTSVSDDDEPRNIVPTSTTNATLGNSCDENVLHSKLCPKISQSDPCIDAGGQVGKQCVNWGVKSGTSEFITKSACKTQTVGSVVANKKHTGNTLAYGGQTSVSTASVIQQGQARFRELLHSIPSARAKEDNSVTMKLARNRIPPKWINLEPCKFSIKRVADLSSVYFEEPHKPQKVLSWTEANNCRPSLKFDMDGPGPCTYSPRTKPLTETNAPVYSFGRRQSSGNVKRARNSETRPRLQPKYTRCNTSIYTGRQLWPSSNSCLVDSVLGSKRATLIEAPAYTFGHRRDFSFVRREAHMDPSPNEYSRQKTDSVILHRALSFTLQFRREGIVLWNTCESNPGPAAYNPGVLSKIKRPAYIIQGARREKSYLTEPYLSVKDVL